MHEEIIFSGFGGQGALFAGQLLAYAAWMRACTSPGFHPTGRRCAVAPRTAPCHLR